MTKQMRSFTAGGDRGSMEKSIKKENSGNVVWRALAIRQCITVSQALSFLLFNALAFVLISLNLRYSDRTVTEWIFGVGDTQHSLGLIVEIALSIILLFNICGCVITVLSRIWDYATSTPVVLTTQQRRLLGIAEDDSRFDSPSSQSASKTPNYSAPSSPFSFSDVSWLFHLTPRKRRSPGSRDIGSPSGSSFGYFNSELSSSTVFEPDHSSPFLERFLPNSSALLTRGASAWSPADSGQTSSPMDSAKRRSAQTPVLLENERSTSSILWRDESIGQVSPGQSQSFHLDQSFGSSLPSPTRDYSTRNFSSNPDYTWQSKPIDIGALAQYRYQPSQTISIDSITAPAATTTTPTGSAKTVNTSPSDTDANVDPIWSRYGVTNADSVKNECLRLRLWISETILKPLLEQINVLNWTTSTSSGGAPDFVIGESSILHLQSIAASKLAQYPTLGALLPYLEIATNQGYLVQRLRELREHDGCLKNFNWNSGSQYKNKPWDDRLPTDSDLIMHLFCTYMNSILTLHPLYPEGKSFSSQYFLQYPSKPPEGEKRKKGYLMIYQNSITPPNYQLLVDEETLEVEKGKNNLVSTLLLFFHHLKSKCYGRLDTVSLGEKGLNVLWVME